MGLSKLEQWNFRWGTAWKFQTVQRLWPLNVLDLSWTSISALKEISQSVENIHANGKERSSRDAVTLLKQIVINVHGSITFMLQKRKIHCIKIKYGEWMFQRPRENGV